MDEASLWYVFVAIIAVILAFDFIFNRKSHHIPLRTAALQTAVWVGVAMAFGVLLFFVTNDSTLTLEYYTAYAIEEAMSMDNLFVFIMIFAYFGIRDEEQHKALFYGVIGAIVFRAIFIFAGVELINRFDWLLYIFGIILIIAAVKTLTEKDDDKGDSKIASFMKTHMNYVESEETRGKIIAKIDGKRVFTILFACVVVIELSDIVFALDSIPAVLAISTDTLVIYTSNIFAVMGLRSLFFVIKGGLNSLCYLKYGLGIILLFVSMKLLTHSILEIPILVSLAVIILVLLITVAASLAHARKQGGSKTA